MPVTKNLQLIQALRGIASLLVVLLHTTGNASEVLHINFLFDFFKFGGAGVDIFFVLSGFIITYTSFNIIANKKNLPAFLRRRFIRIYPIYWIIITLILLSQIILPFFYKTLFQFDLNNLISTYALFPEHTMVNGVSWTLSYELFFYALFCIAFFIPSKRTAFIAALFYGLILLSLPFVGYDYSKGNPWMNLITFPMNMEFVFGITAAVIISKLPNKLSLPFILAGTMFFLYDGYITNMGFVFHNVFHRIILFGIPSFFIVAGVVKYELVNKVAVNKFFLTLGEASYSLYLLHLPLIAASFRLLQKLNIKNMLLLYCLIFITIGLIILFSIIFYMFLERPIIKKLNSLRKIKVANEI